MELEPLPAKQKELKRPSCEALPTLSESKEAKKYLAVTLYDFFQTASIYGREPEALESIMRMFSETLAEYTLPEITRAFVYYRKHFRGMPEPADIATLIERKGRPPFEKSVYISVKKKTPEERTPGEWEYIKDYERFIITGNM